MSVYNFDSTTSPTNYAPSPDVMDGVPPLQFLGNALTSKETPREASYRDGDGFMYVDYYSHGYIDVGADTSYRPTTTRNNVDPSQGTAWRATTVPQAGNVEGMAGCLTGVQTPFDASQVASTSSTLPSRTPGIPMAPLPRSRIRTSQVSTTQRHQCGYALHQSRPCTEETTPKHWVETHVLNEFRLIQKGELTLTEAQILTSDAKVQVAADYFVSCPKGCVWNGTEKLRTYSRRSYLERHLMKSCQVRHSKAEAKQQALEAIRVERRGPKEVVWGLRRVQ